MADSFRTATPLEQLADWLGERFDILEAMMADLTSSLSDLTAAVTDLASDISITLQHQQQAMAQMQSTLDAALANDATDATTIADLRAQLAAMVADSTQAVSQIQALTEAVKAADVGVDQP
jgi:epoxyqueuosine reductase QueG